MERIRVSISVSSPLDSSRFRKAFGYTPPAWDAMLDELARDLESMKAPG